MIRFDYVRDQVNVAIDIDKTDFLARIRPLIRVVGDLPQITFGSMEDNLLKGNAALSLQQLIFL